MLMISNQVSIDSDGKPKCRLGVGFLQVEKSYTEEVQWQSMMTVRIRKISSDKSNSKLWRKHFVDQNQSNWCRKITKSLSFKPGPELFTLTWSFASNHNFILLLYSNLTQLNAYDTNNWGIFRWTCCSWRRFGVKWLSDDVSTASMVNWKTNIKTFWFLCW